MEKEQLIKNSYDMIYLVRCAVNGDIPDRQKVDAMDMDSLFRVCQKNILTACVAYALESAGVHDNEFTQAKAKAIRKNILLDTERNKIFARFEEEKIWYMALKGAVLKDSYSEIGMRQMSDNDILYDGSFREKVRTIMTDMGFECKHFGKGYDDAYFRKPVCNFEMHNRFFSDRFDMLNDYYTNVKERLLKDNDNNYGWHFSNEDFYIYMTAHEYKHYSSGGTGVRSLLDTYIFMKKYGGQLDYGYITAELKKMNISEFEKKSRKLAMKVFSGEKPDRSETEMLDYYILSGTYGNMDIKVKNNMENGSKTKYILKRIFPDMDEIRISFPFFYRYRIFIPVLLFVIRPVKALTVTRKKIISEIRSLKKIK